MAKVKKWSATVLCCCYYKQSLLTKFKFATTVGAAGTFYTFSQISWTCFLIVASKNKQLKIVHILRQTFPQAYESCREKTNHGTMRYLLPAPPLICPLTGHFFSGNDSNRFRMMTLNETVWTHIVVFCVV